MNCPGISVNNVSRRRTTSFCGHNPPGKDAVDRMLTLGDDTSVIDVKNFSGNSHILSRAKNVSGESVIRSNIMCLMTMPPGGSRSSLKKEGVSNILIYRKRWSFLKTSKKGQVKILPL